MEKTKLYKRTARIVGGLLIACTAATIASIPFSGPILGNPGYLTQLAGNETRILAGTLFELVWAVTCAGIAVGLYPILKRDNEALALGSVGLRIVEGVFVLVGTTCLLALLTLSQELAGAGAVEITSFQASGATLMAVRDWAHNVMVIMTFNLGALVYYYLMYKSKLVPRWLTAWGMAGNGLSIVATSYYALTHDLGLIHTLMNVPIALQEMVLAGWLIVKGFNPVAPAARSKNRDNYLIE